MSAVLDLPKTSSIDKIYKAVEMALDEQAAIILSNFAWKTYTQFVSETMGKICNPRFYYDEENLLIMSVSPEHEYDNRIIASLMTILAEQCEKIDCPWFNHLHKRRY